QAKTSWLRNWGIGIALSIFGTVIKMIGSIGYVKRTVFVLKSPGFFEGNLFDIRRIPKPGYLFVCSAGVFNSRDRKSEQYIRRYDPGQQQGDDRAMNGFEHSPTTLVIILRRARRPRQARSQAIREAEIARGIE